jgi:4-hydroxy-tetrahydrodipicolinate synthase
VLVTISPRVSVAPQSGASRIVEVTTGSLVAIVTPMSDDGGIDFAAWDRLIEWHAASGSRALVIGGTTGESATLSEPELRQLTERACARAHGRLGIIVGIGSSSTAATVERARALGSLPIDALLVVTPAYNRPTQEGLYRHFAAVAEAAVQPLVLYNVPSRTAVDMLPHTTGRLSQLPGIIAVKEAVPGPQRVREILAVSRSGFGVLSGDDATAREAILAGARGVISVSANAAPKEMAQMVAAALRADAEQALRFDAPLQELHRALFLEANPIPVKWALAQLGRIGPGIRLPLTELSEAYRPQVLEALRRAEQID